MNGSEGGFLIPADFIEEQKKWVEEQRQSWLVFVERRNHWYWRLWFKITHYKPLLAFHGESDARSS